MTDQEKIAEFLARKGATRIAEGESALNYTPRDWAKTVRRGTQPSNNPINERHTVVDHFGRVRVRNGLGEWIA